MSGEVESINLSGDGFNPTPHAIGVKRPTINPEGILYSSLNEESLLSLRRGRGLQAQKTDYLTLLMCPQERRLTSRNHPGLPPGHEARVRFLLYESMNAFRGLR